MPRSSLSRRSDPSVTSCASIAYQRGSNYLNGVRQGAREKDTRSKRNSFCLFHPFPFSVRGAPLPPAPHPSRSLPRHSAFSSTSYSNRPIPPPLFLLALCSVVPDLDSSSSASGANVFLGLTLRCKTRGSRLHLLPAAFLRACSLAAAAPAAAAAALLYDSATCVS